MGSAEIASDAVTASEIAVDAVGVARDRHERGHYHGDPGFDRRHDRPGQRRRDLGEGGAGLSDRGGPGGRFRHLLRDRHGCRRRAEIATDAVGSAEIAADAVGSSELASNTITGADVQDGSLGKADVSVLSGSVAIDPGPINSQRCSLEQSAAGSVPGIQVGDFVAVNSPSTLDTQLLGVATVQTGADRLTVRICNVAPGTTNDVSGTWTYTVTR